VRRPTRSDLAISAAVGLLMALGPLSSPHLALSVLTGALTALLLLAWRLHYSPPPRADTPRRWQVPKVYWPILVLYAAAAWPTLQWMYSEWTGSVWHNTHGLLIPVLMVLLGRNILRRMPPRAEESSAWGFAFLLPGLAMMAIDAGAATRFLAGVGFVVTLPGLSLLILGKTRTRALALPLCLAIFIVPLPAALASEIYLRRLTAEGVAAILNGMGIPTFVEYASLELPESTFLVADECSGFATLYSSVAMAVLLGSLCPSVPRRVAVYASIVPLALAANVLRVLALVLMFQYIDPSLLDTSIHEASGVATFFVVLFGFLLMTDRPSLSRALL
jgi:exosortase